MELLLSGICVQIAYSRRGCIPNQVSIDDRPAIVDNKMRFGDWEGDTVIGKGHRGALVTLVERKSLYTVIRSILHKTAEAVRNAVVDGLAPHIAGDAGQYVELAVRLGKDAAYRARVVEGIQKRMHVLWEEEKVVREFEWFFRMAYNNVVAAT